MLTTPPLLEIGTNVLDRLFMQEDVTTLFPPIRLPSTVKVVAALGVLIRLRLTPLSILFIELFMVGAGVRERLTTLNGMLRWWEVLRVISRFMCATPNVACPTALYRNLKLPFPVVLSVWEIILGLEILMPTIVLFLAMLRKLLVTNGPLLGMP